MFLNQNRLFIYFLFFLNEVVKLATKVEFLVAEVEVLVAISCAAFDTSAEQTSHLNLFSVETEVMNPYKRYVLFWWFWTVEKEKGNKYHEKEWQAHCNLSINGVTWGKDEIGTYVFWDHTGFLSNKSV